MLRDFGFSKGNTNGGVLEYGGPPQKNEFKTTLPFGSSLNGERELFKGLDETKSTA